MRYTTPRSGGVSQRSSRQLLEFGAIAPQTRALVLFPDEFDLRQVLQALALVRSSHARLSIVVVTCAPRHFAAPRPTQTLFPKPAFGWTILEAIQAHTPPVKS